MDWTKAGFQLVVEKRTQVDLIDGIVFRDLPAEFSVSDHGVRGSRTPTIPVEFRNPDSSTVSEVTGSCLNGELGNGPNHSVSKVSSGRPLLGEMGESLNHSVSSVTLLFDELFKNGRINIVLGTLIPPTSRLAITVSS